MKSIQISVYKPPPAFQTQTAPVGRISWSGGESPFQTQIWGRPLTPPVHTALPARLALPGTVAVSSPAPSLRGGCSCGARLSGFITPRFGSAHFAITLAVGKTSPVPRGHWTFIRSLSVP